MDLKNFIQKIILVEKAISIKNLKVYDFNPWPYIRLAILHKYNVINTENKYSSNIIHSTNNVRKLLDLFQSFKLYVSNPIKHEKVDIIYFTRTSESSELIDGKRLNRYSDSLKYFFEDSYKVKTLEMAQACSTRFEFFVFKNWI